MNREKPRFSTSSQSNISFDSEVCGLSSLELNIFGGKKAEKGSLPWMVSLVSRRGTAICGGVLISRQHVLTAAHCFAVRDWTAGEIELRLALEDLEDTQLEGTKANIGNVKIHER